MAATLDLVVVNPSFNKRVYQGLSDEFAAIEPPVWAGLLASFARNRGYGVAIIDAQAENLGPKETAQRIEELSPTLTAVVVYGHQPSASTQVMPAAGATTTAIKQNTPDMPVIMIGGHVSALPEQTLREEDADYVSTGEGLNTIVELIEAIRTKEHDLTKVRDLMFRDDDGQFVRTPASPLVQDLDNNIPGITWDLLPMNRYRAHNWHCLAHIDQRQPYVAIYTTFGCPYKCSFCCIQAPFKSGEQASGMKAGVNSYRFWSAKHVVDDLEMLVNKYGVYNVKFADEMFVLTRRHVEGICDEIIRRSLKLNIWAYARVDTVKDDMLPKLKKAGFNWLCFGIEAANEGVRGNVMKGYAQDNIRATLKRVFDEGIYVIGNYIFGLPEDDHVTMQETLSLAQDLNCEWANFYSAMAYPGSALYREAIELGWQLPETWGGFSQHAYECQPLPTKHISAAEVLKFRDAAFETYFTDARYLESIRQKFGQPAVDHIQRMTAHRLKRRLLGDVKQAAAVG